MKTRGFAFIALAFAALCSLRCAPEPVALISPPSAPTLSEKAQEAAKWELAIVRNGDLWLAKGNGSDASLLEREANSPCWSWDGRLLAFRQDQRIRVRDFSNNQTIDLGPALTTNEWFGSFSMSFDPLLPMLVAPHENGKLVLYDLKQRSLVGSIGGSCFITWHDDAPAWAPSGEKMAFARNGDVWLLLRSQDSATAASQAAEASGNSKLPFYLKEYYVDARRLASLANWNEGEVGVSARTPFFVDDLAWTRDERRLVFHYQRMGGSGVSQVGFLDLTPVQDKEWDSFSGFQKEIHWLTGIDEIVFSPRICPDGETLSFLTGEELVLSSWTGERRSLISSVEAFAWRPPLNHAR